MECVCEPCVWRLLCAHAAGGSVVAGGLGDYGSEESEDEEPPSARASESSDTDEEELHLRIQEKQDAFRRKERELQALLERQAQEAAIARGEATARGRNMAKYDPPPQKTHKIFIVWCDVPLSEVTVVTCVSSLPHRNGIGQSEQREG